MPTLKLISSDGAGFPLEVDLEIARRSLTIRRLLADLEEDEIKDGIPLPEVGLEILKKVFEWLNHHKDDPPLALKNDTEQSKQKHLVEPTVWDKAFLGGKTQELLLQMIVAAKYLDIQDLLHVCCKTTADLIIKEDPRGIRKAFNIKNDFSAEEEAFVRKENEWCEEK